MPLFQGFIMSCIRFTFVAVLLRLHCCSAYWSSSSLNKVPFRFLNYGKPTYPAAAFFSSNNNSNESNQKAEEKEEDWNPSSTTVTSNDRITYGFSQDSKNKKKKKYNTSGSSTERKKTAAAEFELQELRAQLKEMAQKNINSVSLSLEKRQELEGYIQTVCETATSPIPLGTLATTKPTPLLGLWRLVFSTEKATLSVLPKEATVYVNILTSPEADKDGILEYSLKFAMGALREIKAISTYTIDPGTIYPGLVTFIYQDITSGIFGFKNLPVGFFGLLKGRANYIQSIYFDGSYWFERGYTKEGEVYYNVYYRVQQQ